MSHTCIPFSLQILLKKGTEVFRIHDFEAEMTIEGRVPGNIVKSGQGYFSQAPALGFAEGFLQESPTDPLPLPVRENHNLPDVELFSAYDCKQKTYDDPGRFSDEQQSFTPTCFQFRNRNIVRPGFSGEPVGGKLRITGGFNRTQSGDIMMSRRSYSVFLIIHCLRITQAVADLAISHIWDEY